LVDGAFADDASLVKAGNILKQGVDDFTFTDQWGETKPTTFELYTTFAFLLYKELRCDWVVLETGLGGRLDATNVVIPEASILCPIELEHTGSWETPSRRSPLRKARIIKDGVPAFVGLETEDAMRVFQNEAKERNSRLYSLAEELKAMEYRTTFQGRTGASGVEQWDGRSSDAEDDRGSTGTERGAGAPDPSDPWAVRRPENHPGVGSEHASRTV
jgi:dihydrofolate synthase/folylpolyglutamate synthase